MRRGKPQEATNQDKQAVFEKITAYSWCTDELAKEHPDYTKTSYLASGEYQSQLYTDYPTDPEKGTWNLEQAPDTSWFIVQSNGERLPVTFDKQGNLFGDNKCGELDNAGKSADGLPVITPSKEVAKLISTVTSTPWSRTDDFNQNAEPTKLQFNKDYTLVLSFRNESCKESGYWSVVDGKLTMSSNRDKCDTRSGSQKGLESIDNYTVNDNGVLVEDSSFLYVPTAKHNSKVSTFRLGTYTNAAIDVTVPAGLTSSSAVKTTVKITNTSSKSGYSGEVETMTVKSFSVSSKPNGEGVEASKRVFNNVTIADKQSYEFDTTVDTATANVDGRVYFNVELLGTSDEGTENTWGFYKVIELPKK